MYLVTYLGELCNGLTLFIISKTLKWLSRNRELTSMWNKTQSNVPLFFRFHRCLLSAPFLQTAPGAPPPPPSCFILRCLDTSAWTHTACLWFLLFYRSRWTTLWQKSNPRLITSRTCEYGTILWWNVAPVRRLKGCLGSFPSVILVQLELTRNNTNRW